MKKVFIIISAVLMAVVITLLITLNVKKKNVAIAFDAPSVVRVYNKSTSPTKSSGYKSEDQQYNDILKLVNQMTNISLFERLLKLKTVDTRLEIDNDGTYVSYSTDLKLGNIVIEFDFNEEQDVVVYDNGHTRVISYWCILFVIIEEKDMTDIVVYYSTTNSSQTREDSYAKCKPIILKGDTKSLVDYVKGLKK